MQKKSPITFFDGGLSMFARMYERTSTGVSVAIPAENRTKRTKNTQGTDEMPITVSPIQTASQEKKNVYYIVGTRADRCSFPRR